MPIKNIVVDLAGEVGITPRLIRINTTDSFSTITATNYLHSATEQGITFYPTDLAAVTYADNVSQFFSLEMSGGDITLVPFASNIDLPVTSGYIAVFDGTAGRLASGATTATNPGNIHAGLSGTAGSLVSYPATAAKGALKFFATANDGNWNCDVTNEAMGQATTITIPDPGDATADFVVAPSSLVLNNLVKAAGAAGLIADAGARIISGTTAAYAGGGTSHAFAVTGLTVAAVGSAVIRASTNNVSIVKALPGTNTLTITFSADPGADTTVDYIYTTSAMT